MKVLVACEYSGRVRDAFLAKGHDAISCDLEPSDTPGPHYQGDVFDILRSENWDLVLAFPPCTDLSWANGKLIHEKRADGRTQAALEFAIALSEAGQASCVENPRGDLYKWRKPDQVIQPWMFGEPYYKTTCLWLRGLPPLVPHIVEEPEGVKYWVSVGAARGAERRLGVGEHRNTDKRNLTFISIANAMAEQWG